MALEPITRQEKIIAGQDLTPITRMEKFLKEFGGSGGGGARPDWNAAEGEPGHILNRPFYESTEVLFDQRVEVLSEERMIEGALPISAGDLVKVTWNGVEYECTAFTGANNLVFFGNTGFMGGEDNGIPFAMATGTIDGQEMFGIIAPYFVGQTVSVKVEGLVVKTIDPKFIPAGVGGGVVIVTESEPNQTASGVATASMQWFASISLASIAKAVYEGKQVYFYYNDEVLLPFAGGVHLNRLAKGVMTTDGASEPYAIFGMLNNERYYQCVRVYANNSISFNSFTLAQ